MKTAIQIFCAAAALFLTTGGASAQSAQYLAGRLEITQDTNGAGACGGHRGESWFFFYRLNDGTIPGSLSLSQEGANVLIKSLDESGDFFTDGTKGKMAGTIHFSSAGDLSVTLGTMQLATYTLMMDTTDPTMLKISRMTAHFKLKETGQVCSFVWNGVATPAAYNPL